MKSSLPFTSVVSYHTNEYGCGVAKFGKLLAERLGVPFGGLDALTVSGCPLFSLKSSELSKDAAWILQVKCHALREAGKSYGFFWHDEGRAILRDEGVVVYHADPSLGANGLWCPSLLTPSKPRTVKLFTMGMAHKLQTQHYRKVRELLDAAGLRYHLRVSVGLHEGTSLSDATQHFDALYEILGRDNVTVLGILSDDAVVEELSAADYVLAFFERGLRANNTTVHAALAYGKRIFTNHDNLTPQDMARRTHDIINWQVWPSTELWTWDQLIQDMERIYAKNTHNRQPAPV